MKGDYYQDLAKSVTGDAKSKFAEGPYPWHLDVPYVNSIVQTMQKTVEVPQVVYIDKTVDVSMVSQMQAPMIQKVLKTVEAPEMQYTDKIVELPAVMQYRVSTIQPVQKNRGSATSSIP